MQGTSGDMNNRERRRFSLRGRTALLVVLLALIIGISALGLAYVLYDASITREFNTRTTYVARITASSARQHMRSVREVNAAVTGIYKDNIPGDDEELGSDYLDLYKDVMDRNYGEVRSALTNIQVKYKTRCAFIGIVDKLNNNMIYAVSSNLSDQRRATGMREKITDADLEIYRNGAPITGIGKLSGSIVNPTVVYIGDGDEALCRGGCILYEDNRYAYIAFADLDSSEIRLADQMFVAQYLALLLMVIILAEIIVGIRIRKTITDPINELAAAASSFSRDRSEGRYTFGHFDKVDIRTGDEIENLSFTMKEMEEDLQEYIENLTEITAEKERNNTEMDVARSIQMGMIPHTFPAFPDRPEFEIYASMDPARRVGGDFYNFFMIDDNHVALMIADVTGKGVPAALFMMSSKMTIESVCMRGDKSPGRILRKVNEEILANNPAEMFVTVWLGILEISTGIMRCANAGHEYPAIKRADGTFSLFKDPHGFVVGVLEDMDYPEYELQLHPGDMVFQYTDGATDAVNSREEFFGMDRVMAAINSDPDAGPDEILDNVSKAIEEFSEGTEQFDDLTMIVLTYAGTSKMKKAAVDDSIEVEAVLENLDTINEFLENHLEEAGCDMKTTTQLIMCAEEIYTNICKFAYTPDTGNATVRFRAYEDPAEVRITFMDHGLMFDPLKHEDPDVTLKADERKVGGLGLYLVKKMTDKVTYEYTDGMNILTMRKKI